MEVLGTLGCKSECLKRPEMGEWQTSAFERVFITVRSGEMRRARAEDGGFVGAMQWGGMCHWVEEGGNHTPPPWRAFRPHAQGAERLHRSQQGVLRKE